MYSNLFQFHWNLDNFSRKYLNFRISNKLDIRITRFIRSQSILVLFKSYAILYYAIHGIFSKLPVLAPNSVGWVCVCVSVVNLKGFSWFYRLFWHIKMWEGMYKNNDWQAENNGKIFVKCVVILAYSCHLIFVMQIFNQTAHFPAHLNEKLQCQKKFNRATLQ